MTTREETHPGRALVLCSGGMDSIVTVHYAKKKLQYENLSILFFNYGQKPWHHERTAALHCARALGIDFKELFIPELGRLSPSLLTKDAVITADSPIDLKNTVEASEPWYVPSRNMLFLSYALALAESSALITNVEPPDILVGFKNEGKEPFPDTTSEFLERMNALAATACKRPARILAPLLSHDKEDIVTLGIELGVPLERTWSCYLNKQLHCGTCLACCLRKEGFKWANIEDPTPYLAQKPTPSSPAKYSGGLK